MQMTSQDRPFAGGRYKARRRILSRILSLCLSLLVSVPVSGISWSLSAAPASAETSAVSQPPPARPQQAVPKAGGPAKTQTAATKPTESRPQPRPDGLQAADSKAEAAQAARRAENPGSLFGKASPDSLTGGALCGDRAIQGQRLARITSKISGCGIAEPVRVSAIDGIRLSQPATLDCVTAKALHSWIDKGLRPAYAPRKVVELKVAAHYICRPRNNRKGARISEHGRGRAIDISGIVTSDGRTQMVLKGFDKTMRRAYKAACGIFGTTLGPGSDGYHEDHMHFDVPSNRRSPYCH